MSNQPIFVTQPSLPPLSELTPYLERIWEGRVLTNGGPLHEELESALCEYLNIPFISLFSNGTIALITAIKALGLKGEVITTPYSFVATAHSIMWNGLKPVFVDIDPVTLNIDPKKIESAITNQTTAILPVHVYGNSCDVDAIEHLAKKYNLKIIYDAAHAFGVNCHCGSILNHGDLSVLSFHATKVFNTFEGGAIVSKDLETKKLIDKLKNFGIINETTVTDVGINGKMSEFNSAIGLLQLKHMDVYLKERAEIDSIYRNGLRNIGGIRCLAKSDSSTGNFGYFPIFIDDGYPLSRDALYEALKNSGINCRRYFYPLISEYPMYSNGAGESVELFPVAADVSARVLCLPIYGNIERVQISRILDEIIGYSS